MTTQTKEILKDYDHQLDEVIATLYAMELAFSQGALGKSLKAEETISKFNTFSITTGLSDARDELRLVREKISEYINNNQT